MFIIDYQYICKPWQIAKLKTSKLSADNDSKILKFILVALTTIKHKELSNLF